MKRCLIGYTPDHAGQEALMLARSIGAAGGLPLVVCNVVPKAWDHPSLARLGQGYADFLAQHAQAALAQARSLLEDAPGVRYISQAAGSATLGLTEAARQQDAGLIVIGSSRDGPAGRLSLGSVSSEIMHMAEVPVAMAPRHTRHSHHTTSPPARLSRLTCAYAGLDAAGHTAQAALKLAAELNVPLRLVSFAVRDRQMYPSPVGYGSERAVVAAWREQAQASLERVQQQLAQPGRPIEIAVADGESWEEALQATAWHAGEMLALGSSRAGVLQRVFLGSNATKIMRASPVPVVVLPRAS